MTRRARETAEAILRHLPQASMWKPCRLLEEVCTCAGPNRQLQLPATPGDFHPGRSPYRVGIPTLLPRAAPDQQSDSYELLVCHANVIRYFVCRALQLPPEAWLRFSLDHASITWVTIRPAVEWQSDTLATPATYLLTNAPTCDLIYINIA
uniref:Serine/threonine-protein phosphatase PGAM5, mitochondrial n=1 Tax=Macrostomum lignano TaxID=282301 RepID=A0A1I8F429_9PLAT